MERTTPITNSDAIIADIAQRKEAALKNAIAEVEVTYRGLSPECFNQVGEYIKGKPQLLPVSGNFFAFADLLPNLTVAIYSVKKSVEDDNN